MIFYCVEVGLLGIRGTAGGQWGVVRVHECEGLTSKKIIMRRNHIWKVLGHYSTPQFQKKAENVKKSRPKMEKRLPFAQFYS